MSALIYSNVYVSLCAASLVWATRAQLGAEIGWVDPMVGLVFFATLLVYNLDRILPASAEDRAGPASARHGFIQARKNLLAALAIAGAVGALVCGVMLPFGVFVALVPLGVIAIGYSIPWIPTRQGWRRLKDIPGLKIFLIALVWAVVTVTLPAWLVGVEPWSASASWVMLERAAFIFAITLPFDIRDLARDRAASIQTIPVLLGERATKAIALVVLGALAVSAVSRWGMGAGAGVLAPIAAYATTAALVAAVDEERGEMFYAFAIEGTMLLLSVSALAGGSLA